MKTKIIAVLVAVMASLGWHAHAQTNVAPILRTNFVTAAQSFREVNGKLYNSERSVLWVNFDGKCLKVSSNGILIQTFKTEPVYEASTRSIASHNYLGQVTSSRIVPTTVQVGTKEVPDMQLFLQNYPANLNPAVGQTISFRALRIGTTDFNGDKLELWDYGTPHVVMVVTTNYPPQLKADKK